MGQRVWVERAEHEQVAAEDGDGDDVVQDGGEHHRAEASPSVEHLAEQGVHAVEEDLDQGETGQQDDGVQLWAQRRRVVLGAHVETDDPRCGGNEQRSCYRQDQQHRCRQPLGVGLAAVGALRPQADVLERRRKHRTADLQYVRALLDRQVEVAGDLGDLGVHDQGDPVEDRAADLGDYLTSLRRLAAYDEVTALPGHGPALADCAAAARFYLAHRQARLDQVRQVVARGVTDPAAVVAEVYATVDRALWPAAEWSVRAQLAYLGASPDSVADSGSADRRSSPDES